MYNKPSSYNVNNSTASQVLLLKVKLEMTFTRVNTQGYVSDTGDGIHWHVAIKLMSPLQTLHSVYVKVNIGTTTYVEFK